MALVDPREYERDDSLSQRELLLRIYRQLGGIEKTNEAILREQADASLSRGELYRRLEASQGEILALKIGLNAATVDIALMKPDMARIKGVRIQMALAAAAFGSLVGGTFHLIWLAISHTSEIKQFLRGLLNG